MTLPIQTPLHLMNADAPSDCCSYRWPEDFAKNMADMIHQQVCDMLSQSRLHRQDNGIQLVRRDDIVRTDSVLGLGAFSQVSSVTAKDGRQYACKHLKQNLMDQPENFRLAAAEMACEAHMLASFDHPHILKIRGWAYNGIASFEDGFHDSFFLLLDQLDETLDQRIDRWRAEVEQQAACSIIAQGTHAGIGTLWRRLRHHPASPESVSIADEEDHRLNITTQLHCIEKLEVMQGVASALEYLHERGVIFRDLKPNNIGFLGNHVQLFDFGLSRELPALDTSVPFEMSGKVGTLRYMAPEVAMHQPYNVAADVYSWAMVCYETLSLEKPFNGWTRDMHADLVCNRGSRPDTVDCLGMVPQEMRVLLEHCWSGLAVKRPPTHQIPAQVQLIRDKQLLVLEEQQLQQHLSRQFEQHQEVAAAVAMVIDMPHFPPAPRKRMRRTHSFESIETIETSSLSADGQDW